MNKTRRSLDRIEHLVEVRQTYVAAAEAGVREAEGLVRHLEEQARDIARQIQQTREDFAYLKSFSGREIQAREKHVFSLNFKARRTAQDLEKAVQVLDKRRTVWREKMKDKKIVERVQVRRVQEWKRSVDVKEQQQVDEMSVGRHARDKSRPAGDPDAAADARAGRDSTFVRTVDADSGGSICPK